ncbi:MAG: guanylate kinase [Lachnospiraceae bacterium]|nr:guanylate kinase [Lachnospiraceae bacterium]
MEKKGILIVISGFAGAGKGTVVNRLREKYEGYALSISMTSRNPRPGDVEGKNYFFVTREKFEKTIAENGLLEYAEYCGNYYGTPKAYVEEQLEKGNNVILEIEIQGATNIKKAFPESLLIFITPPSAAELEKRLRGRGTETEEQIGKRLGRAAEESAGMDTYDYIVVNDEVEKCVDEIHSIIDIAHREPVRMKTFISELQDQLKVYK